MSSQTLNYKAVPSCSSARANECLALRPQSRFVNGYSHKQRGVVLFITLVALLAMSLAAVALIRSVDTSALITGNLAFRQTATASADAGIEAAMNKLNAMQALFPNSEIRTDPANPLNQTNLAVYRGYFSSFDPGFDVTDPANWTGNNFDFIAPDQSGNSVSYIIQRMCRTSDIQLEKADCLLAQLAEDASGQQVKSAPEVCPAGKKCEGVGQPAQIRITVRSTGPNRSVSYVQGFVY